MEKKGNLAKVKLIETAAALFIENGFYATGIQNILEKSGMSKGSFYFYFRSKKELAFATAEYYGRKLIDEWLEVAAKDRMWSDFVRSVCRDLTRFAEDKSLLGCPIAILGGESSFQDPDITEKYRIGVMRIIAIFENVLKRTGIPSERIKLLAGKSFALYEGYMVLFRLTKDKKYFTKLASDLEELAK